jgi:hypothetical protein
MMKYNFFLRIRLHDFWYETKTKSKKYAKEKGFSV